MFVCFSKFVSSPYGILIFQLKNEICMQDWLGGLDIKYYESKINLNWKPILKSIIAVCPLTGPLTPKTTFTQLHIRTQQNLALVPNALDSSPEMFLPFSGRRIGSERTNQSFFPSGNPINRPLLRPFCILP